MSMKQLVPTVLFTLILAGCGGTQQPDMLRGEAVPQGCSSASQEQGLRGVAYPQTTGLQGTAFAQDCSHEAHPQPTGLVGVAQALPNP